MHARSETARIAAIRELPDRGYGKPTQFLATDDDAVPEKLASSLKRTGLFGSPGQLHSPTAAHAYMTPQRSKNG